MLAWNAGELDYSRLVDRYQELRTVGWKLHNEVLPKYLSERAFSVCGKKLGIWQQGALVFDREDEIGILMDYSIHEHRQGGCNAVQRYLADRRPDAGSDEYAVAKAMSRSFYTLVQVREVLRGIGVRVADLFAGCEYLLLDMGFGKTAVPGIVIATRIYPYDDFVTTGGAPLIVTAESLRETRDTLLPRYGPENEGQCVLRGGRERATDLATAIIRLCLRREVRQIEYESPARGPALTPVRSGPHMARNAPCPCGSGRKYKKCCGQTP